MVLHFYSSPNEWEAITNARGERESVKNKSFQVNGLRLAPQNENPDLLRFVNACNRTSVPEKASRLEGRWREGFYPYTSMKGVVRFKHHKSLLVHASSFTTLQTTHKVFTTRSTSYKNPRSRRGFALCGGGAGCSNHHASHL